MTPDEAKRILRSLEDRSIEHTILLAKIAKAVTLAAAAAVVIALLVFAILLRS